MPILDTDSGYFYLSDPAIYGTLFAINGIVYYVSTENFKKIYNEYGYRKLRRNKSDCEGIIYRLPNVNMIYGGGCKLFYNGTLRMSSNNCLIDFFNWLFKRKRKEVPMLGSLQTETNENNLFKPRDIVNTPLSGVALGFQVINHVPIAIEFNEYGIMMHYNTEINKNAYQKLQFKVIDYNHKKIHLKKLQ